MDKTDLEAAAAYGDNCADFYDQIYSRADPRMIDVLVSLSNRGPVLELGIGTGRVALPMLARGIAVSGIEASPKMIAKLRVKPGAGNLLVTHGNCADSLVQGPFTLVYSLVSTFCLLSFEEQQRCFDSVTKVLGTEGVLLLENFAPSRSSCSSGPDWFKQLVRTAEGTREYASRVSYASPAMLDEMAKTAGLKLSERWADWSQRPYTSSDSQHISLYQVM